MRTHDGRAHVACAQAVFVRIDNCLGSVNLFCGRNYPYVNFTQSAKSLRTNRVTAPLARACPVAFGVFDFYPPEALALDRCPNSGV